MTTRTVIRKQVRTKRKALSNTEQHDASLAVCNMLIEKDVIQRADTIALYLASDGELDLSPFINWCWQQGKTLYLPVIHPFSKGYLLFLAFRKNEQLVNNKYGIKEPKLSVCNVLPMESLDVMLTPLVAFDDKGNRLGMGGGYYDRTLQQWHYGGLPQLSVVGVAHDCQLVEHVPIDSWDIPIPTIITPSKVFQFNQ
ncbi:5-formyltetrahydrofolate cyclo-ligase [Thalassotalea agarivorans]|uniref:5-formyltetrahydrofolate cyclo-ligase n=1 Tax=Thalassotalea agarivorans TaxID=349064 RepID=A0A1H9YHU3_THASX|nr:5-formyltetrahydrofolate cyclo-ligase [Thalassotalea agarivorans]SES68622.1 5-formyltetrahydrofolate cyclo-ligase [Thalassotalea agarivorans]